MDGWDGRGCGFSVRPLLVAGLFWIEVFFPFLTMKKMGGFGIEKFSFFHIDFLDNI